jgi:hypothetical protein
VSFWKRWAINTVKYGEVKPIAAWWKVDGWEYAAEERS